MKGDSQIKVLCGKLNLPEGTVTGILGDIARQKDTRESQNQIATRWGVPYGAITSCRFMGKVTIAEIREGAVSKYAMIGDVMQDAVMDDIANPLKLASIAPEKKMVMAKQAHEAALNLSNGQVGPRTQQVNIGELKVLIAQRQERGKFRTVAEELGKTVTDALPELELPVVDVELEISHISMNLDEY